VDEEELIKFQKSSASGSASRNFWRFFNVARWRIFPQFGSYSWKNRSYNVSYIEIWQSPLQPVSTIYRAAYDVSLDAEIPVKFPQVTRNPDADKVRLGEGVYSPSTLVYNNMLRTLHDSKILVNTIKITVTLCVCFTWLSLQIIIIVIIVTAQPHCRNRQKSHALHSRSAGNFPVYQRISVAIHRFNAVCLNLPIRSQFPLHHRNHSRHAFFLC